MGNWSIGVLEDWSNGALKNWKSKSPHTLGAFGKCIFLFGIILMLGCLTMAQAAEMRLFDIAGNGHAWKKGIPERIKERSSFTYAVLLPEIPENLEKDTVALEDADYLMLGVSK